MDQQNTQTPNASSDMEQAKVIAIIGYVIPLLFFLPLVMDNLKNNSFSKFHANQHLNLLLFWVVGQVAASMLSFIIIGLLLFPVVYVGGFVLMIVGAISASKGETKPLPVIGQFNLMK